MDTIKIILPAVLTFFIGISITPFVTDFLYKNKMWKKQVKSVASFGMSNEVFRSLHSENEVKTPRLGGSIIWLSVLISTAIVWFFSKVPSMDIFSKLEFVSRDQTWVPFAAFFFGALIGLIDDMLEIKGLGGNISGGLSLKKRLAIVGMIGVVVAVWFHLKLDVSAINLPFFGAWHIGWLIVPLFTAVIMAIYSGGIIDGVDGLAGGVFATIFAAYGVIAFSLNQINLGAFCAAIVGGILAFLWFNIPPARFYMSETGSMALTIALSIVAFMTDRIGGGYGLFVLPIIALPLILTSLSVIVQLTYKKFTGGKKIFLSTPIHHHFEAIGWPKYKVTMRYWVFSFICAGLGIVISFSLI